MKGGNTQKTEADIIQLISIKPESKEVKEKVFKKCFVRSVARDCGMDLEYFRNSLTFFSADSLTRFQTLTACQGSGLKSALCPSHHRDQFLSNIEHSLGGFRSSVLHASVNSQCAPDSN